MIKKSIFNCVFFLLLAASGITCKKDDADKVYRGTIFKISCEKIGIDINGDTGTGGGAVYQDHTNAANIRNYCLVFDMKLAVGDVITFKTSDQAIEPGSNCLIGYCLGSGPSNGIFIHDVVKIN